jgi:type I restriction enzyme R subunit
MTDKITENTIENFCIKLLEKQGYEYIYAPDIAPDSDNPLRNSFEEVILPNRLNNAVEVLRTKQFLFHAQKQLRYNNLAHRDHYLSIFLHIYPRNTGNAR